MLSLARIFGVSLQAVLQIFVLQACGVALKRGADLLKAPTRKDISNVVFQCALPCLLIAKVSAIDVSDLGNLVLMSAAALINVGARAYLVKVVGTV